MDVIFEVQKGTPFSIEVGFFDTVLEIKEKVQKYQGIPISKQTLIFNGKILQDDGDIWKCEIFQNSRINLIVAAADSEDPTIPIAHDNKFHLNVKTPSSKSHIPMKIDKNNTTSKLKEKIHDIDQNNVPLRKGMLHATKTKLPDNKILRDCDVSEKRKIGVSFKTQVSAEPAMVGGRGRGRGASKKTQVSAEPAMQVGGRGKGRGASKKTQVSAEPAMVGGRGKGRGASKKLKQVVLPKSGTKKAAVEMNTSDNLGESRK